MFFQRFVIVAVRERIGRQFCLSVSRCLLTDVGGTELPLLSKGVSENTLQLCPAGRGWNRLDVTVYLALASITEDLTTRIRLARHCRGIPAVAQPICQMKTGGLARSECTLEVGCSHPS